MQINQSPIPQMITVDKRFFAKLIGYLQKAFQNKQGTAVEKNRNYISTFLLLESSLKNDV